MARDGLGERREPGVGQMRVIWGEQMGADGGSRVEVGR